MEDFADTLDLPKNQGIRIRDKYDFSYIPEFNLSEAISVIRKEPTNYDALSISMSELSLQSQLIHSIIGYCIYPRSGSRSSVTNLDILLIWAISTGVRINFADLIFHQLIEVTERQKGNLPYGMALTVLFMSWGIDTSIETDIYVPGPHDWYSKHTLHLMHYEIRRNKWVLKERAPQPGQPAAADQEEEQEDVPEPIAMEEGHSSQLTNQELYDKMLSNFERMDTNFQSIDSNFQRMDSNFDQVFNQLNTTNAHIHGIEDYLHSKDEDSNFPPW